MNTLRKTVVFSQFRALSEPIRLRLLCLLRHRELCVCDLVEILSLPQPTVSRHLSYLRRSKLVLARREGQWMYYRLPAAKSALDKRIRDCLDACMTEVPEVAADARLLATKRRGRC